MAYLLANLPPVEVLVKKEYLYDFTKGHGETTPGYWVTVKSIKGRALYFETYLTEYGALYDKLPISAFVWKIPNGDDTDYPLEYLELWDAFSYNISVIEKSLLKDLDVAVYMKDKSWAKGTYMFTIDSCHSDSNELDVSLSQTPNEHKSFNIIKLDNGQFAAQPNNRTLFYDQSLTPAGIKVPDFKVSTKKFVCEQGDKWATGESDEFFYNINKKEQ